MFMIINSGKTLALWVLALEQESYLPYIKKVIKKILQITDLSHSYLDAIIFLPLNISYTILCNGYFRNLKINQLLSQKNYITHTSYYT